MSENAAISYQRGLTSHTSITVAFILQCRHCDSIIFLDKFPYLKCNFHEPNWSTKMIYLTSRYEANLYGGDLYPNRFTLQVCSHLQAGLA